MIVYILVSQARSSKQNETEQGVRANKTRGGGQIQRVSS